MVNGVFYPIWEGGIYSSTSLTPHQGGKKAAIFLTHCSQGCPASLLLLAYVVL